MTKPKPCEVIDFWRLLEFMNQRTFPSQTKKEKTHLQQVRASERKRRNADTSGGRERKVHPATVKLFEEFKSSFLIDPIMFSQSAGRDYPSYPLCSEVHICAGSFSRKQAYLLLCEALDFDTENHPENVKNDKLACFAFRVDSEGCYLPESFAFSPVLWALSCIDEAGSLEVSDLLSNEKYQKDILEIAKTLVERGRIPVAEVHLIRLKKKVFEKFNSKEVVSKLCVTNDCTLSQARSSQIEYEPFLDDSTLSNSFFLQDLQWVKESLNSPHADLHQRTYLENYILAPTSQGKSISDNPTDGIIVSEISTPEEVLSFIDVTMNVGDTPLGKWPSRYKPALMQQAAINLALKAQSEGSYFSVNGPPGTGKTTLLKEIIAENIVQKACLLMEYTDPDDAFEMASYQDGKAYKHNGYSAYSPQYAKLKDPSIAKHGVLVASSNNNAVENITAELPGLTSLMQCLGSKDNRSSSLEEIKELFNPSAEAMQTLGLSDVSSLEHNVFHTQYANKVLPGEKPEDVPPSWGLISAPLGKKKNETVFAKRILSPFVFDQTNAHIDERKKKGYYKKVVAAFRAQLKVVKDERQMLQANCKVLSTWVEAKSKLTQACNDEERLFRSEDEQLVDLGRMLDAARSECCVVEKSRSKEEEVVSLIRKRVNAKVLEKEEVTKQLEIDFRMWEHQQRILKRLLTPKSEKLAGKKRLDLSRAEMDVLKNELKELYRDQQIAEERLEQQESKRQECLKKSKGLEEEIDRIQGIRRIRREKIAQLRKNFEQAQEQMNALVLASSESSGFEKPDTEFINAFLSEDQEEKSTAHSKNLWTTDEYDRAREKLLYAALQVLQEFVLSSKCVKHNMRNLLLMWNIELTVLEHNGEKVPPGFSERDKKAAYSHLINTLLLIVPVISTTFASVQRFLSDVDDPRSLGLLVVDEAGQAPPYYALGAIVRCSSSLFVGDPKQVEPVITNEVDAIRGSIRQESLFPYRAKAISVQYCADMNNSAGTYLCDSESGEDQWVGFPLVVHRRCIDPMFSISNEISYGNTMCQLTTPISEDKAKRLVFEKSYWLNVAGRESGEKNHYIDAQGKEAFAFIREAFEKADSTIGPSLFIITPFKTVEIGLRGLISGSEWYKTQTRKTIDEWMENSIGTIHTFQGKEADEVIFLLGCDNCASGAISWVNSNIVNVAVSRAKYRLCIIGDSRVWKNNAYVSAAKRHLDTYALKKALELLRSEETGSDGDYQYISENTPPACSFVIEEEGEWVIAEDTLKDSFGALTFPQLDEADCQKFGIDQTFWNMLGKDAAQNLEHAIKVYKAFLPVSQYSRDVDASFCSILFCKTFEEYLKSNLKVQFAAIFDSKVFSEGRRITIGNFSYCLKPEKGGSKKLSEHLVEKDEEWCRAFYEDFQAMVDKRNKCCHERFEWNDMSDMLNVLFRKKLFKNTAYLENSLQMP